MENSRTTNSQLSGGTTRMRGRAVRGECVAATTCMMTNLVGCTDTFPAVSVAHKLAATYTCVSPLFHPTLYHHCGCRLCPEDGVDQDRFSFLHTLLFTDVCHVMPLRGSGCSHFDGVWQFNCVCVDLRGSKLVCFDGDLSKICVL